MACRSHSRHVTPERRHVVCASRRCHLRQRRPGADVFTPVTYSHHADSAGAHVLKPDKLFESPSRAGTSSARAADDQKWSRQAHHIREGLAPCACARLVLRVPIADPQASNRSRHARVHPCRPRASCAAFAAEHPRLAVSACRFWTAATMDVADAMVTGWRPSFPSWACD